MRLTTVILIASFMQVSASTLAQKITLSKTNMPLKTVLKDLRKQTGYLFLYSDHALNKSKLVNIQVNQEDFYDVLKKLFADQPLSYSVSKNTIVIKEKVPSFLDRVLSAFAAIDVRGRVVDEKDGPLPGATITLKVSGKTVMADSKGEFYLQNIEEGTILVISYLGYEPREVKATKELGKVQLILSQDKLEEVEINAGYYKVKDRERTGSISRVTADQIQNQPVLNPLAALTGRMPGVNIIQSSGIPGSGFSVQIRGRNSITGSGSPLYIIDGVPFSSEGMGSFNVGFILGTNSSNTGSSINGLSPLVGINPGDIESIEVLKDADATAIYGSRGANGVVLITTKRAKSEQAKINLRYSHGMGRITKMYDLMNTQQYLEIRREAFSNDRINTIPASAYDVNGTWDQNRYTDWQKELVGGTAFQNNLQGTIQGGNEYTNFLLSAGMINESTVFPGDYKNQKLSSRAVINHNSIDQKFKASANISYMVDKNDFPGVDLNYYAVSLAPNAPSLYQEDGKLNWENNTFENPMANLEQRYLSTYDNLTLNLTLSQELWKGFVLTSRFGVNRGWMDESRIQPHTMINPSYGYGPEASSIGLSETKRQSWIIEPQLNYKKELHSDLVFDALIGLTFQENIQNFLEQNARGFTSNSLLYDIKSASRLSVLASSDAEYRYSAAFARMNLSWKKKLFMNLTGRRDGSSRFGPGKQFANFGAIGAAYIFSDEKFIKDNLSFLSFGKLRASYGLTGSDNIGDYKFMDTYGSSAVSYQGKIGLAPTGLFNPNFAWETNSKLEGALDLGILDNKINLSVSYYYNRSSNQLVGIPLSVVTGFPSINANLDATVQNTGWEFELNSKNWHSKRFTWSTSFNMTIPKNKLISFPNLETSTYANQYVVGQPLNIYKRYHYLGVDPQTGIYTYEDVNHDGLLNIQDRQSILNFDPKFYGGLNNNFTFGAFQLDIFFQYVKQLGRNYIYNFSGSAPGFAFNQPVEILDRWQSPGNQSNIQRVTTSGYTTLVAYSNLYNSTASMSDASYIRLKNLSLSYSIPKNVLKRIGANVFVQGQNLWTITSYKGADPESNGTANAGIPPLRMWTFGFELNF